MLLVSTNLACLPGLSAAPRVLNQAIQSGEKCSEVRTRAMRCPFWLTFWGAELGNKASSEARLRVLHQASRTALAQKN